MASSVQRLLDLPALRSLYLWETAVRPAAMIERFAERNPRVRVHLGLESLPDDSSSARGGPPVSHSTPASDLEMTGKRHHRREFRRT